MANFTYFIRERVKLNGVERGSNVEKTIQNINYADTRVMSIPSGSMTEIINLNNLPGAGTFVSSSVKYARISNLSTGSINLQVSGSTIEMNYLVTGSGTFMFSSEFVNETFNDFEYGDLRSIKATPIDPDATLSYFICTT
jgi:hypothetical protein